MLWFQSSRQTKINYTNQHLQYSHERNYTRFQTWFVTWIVSKLMKIHHQKSFIALLSNLFWNKNQKMYVFCFVQCELKIRQKIIYRANFVWYQDWLRSSTDDWMCVCMYEGFVHSNPNPVRILGDRWLNLCVKHSEKNHIRYPQ